MRGLRHENETCIFPGCTNRPHGHGYCTSHQRQLKSGAPLAPLWAGKRRPGTDRAAIDAILAAPPTNECIVWAGWIDQDGYGRTRHGGRSTQITHIVLEAVGRPVPDGQCACHSCDNRACVNPRHLWVGTHTENLSDRDGKRRQAFGERNGRSKLTEADVRAIRELRSIGMTQQAIASRFGVAQYTISMILNRKIWAFVV